MWRIFWLGDRWIGDDDDNDSVRSAILFLKSGTAGGGVEEGERENMLCFGLDNTIGINEEQFSALWAFLAFGWSNLSRSAKSPAKWRMPRCPYLRSCGNLEANWFR